MGKWEAGLAILLGYVEGITEFLPVSSTGHLILLGHWIGFTGAAAAKIDMAIQLGAILAIVVYERRQMASILVHAASEGLSILRVRQSLIGDDLSMSEGWSYLFYRVSTSSPHFWLILGLSLAFVPSAALGLLVADWIQTSLYNPTTVAVALIGGGGIMLAVEARPQPPRMTSLTQVNLRTALWVGLAQCLALIPGVSRPGATIVGGMLAGMDRRMATEYSFLLAVPTMLAATTYTILSMRDLLTDADVLTLVLGMGISFLVGWSVIGAFLAFLKLHTLRVFAYYRILLGVTLLMLGVS